MSDEPEALRRKFRESVGKQFLLAVTAAAIFFLFFWISSPLSDSAPHAVDGQCGMPTFFGRLFGAVGAIVIILVSSVAIGIGTYYRR